MMLPLTMDAYRSGDTVHVVVDAAGVHPDDLDVTVEETTLTISATRTWDPTDDDHVYVAERRHGKFSRTLQLGEHLDLDALEATCADGVLHLTIPVAETAKPRRVDVGRKSVAA